MKTIHQITALLLSALLIGCAGMQQWNAAHKQQVLDTGKVVLASAARDAFNITLDAVAKEATTGFNSDWGNSLAQGTYEALPSIVNTDDVNKVLAIWNPAAPKVNTQLVDVVSKGASAASVAGQKDPRNVKAVATAVAVAVQAASNGVPQSVAVNTAVQAAQAVTN